MIAISDTSPLILLEKTGYLRILGKLFKSIVIPPAVDKEWLRSGCYIHPSCLSIITLSHEAELIADGLCQKMDKGEAEAISLFSDIKADWLLLDDLKSRKYAYSQNLPVTGTAGILITARKKGFIPELRPILESLKKQRLYLSDEVFQKALILADEI